MKIVAAIVIFVFGAATLLVLWSHIPDGFFERLANALRNTGWRVPAVRTVHRATSTPPVVLHPADTGTKKVTRKKTATTTPVVIVKPKPISFAGKIRISSVSSGSDFTSIVLFNQSNIAINVTDWKMQGRTGILTIPQAIEFYHGNALFDQNTNIILKPNQSLSLYSNATVIGGGFRVNKCMGYLTNNQRFVPSFSASCPSRTPKNISDFSSKCQDIIRSIGSCELPRTSVITDPNDVQCKDFLATLNYEDCVLQFRADKDFFQQSWHVWLGEVNGRKKEIVDPRHDKIKLLTDTGELVDEYVY